MPGPSTYRNSFDPVRLALIDEWMQHNIDRGRFTGSSMLLARQGDTVHFGSAGHHSVERNLAYERDTIVRIYSMTKMVTTVGFMMLVERGLVHLATPAAEYFPSFADARALVSNASSMDQVESVDGPTLHQLLTHTSGLTYAFNPGLLAQHYDALEINFSHGEGGLETVCQRVSELPLAFKPGRNWNYSVGIDLIGRVIEQISGRSLDRYLHEEIFEPLGMVDTGFSVPTHALDRFADCYLRTDEDPIVCCDRAASSSYLGRVPDTLSGGGGLVSTLDDYLRFGEMIRLGGRADGRQLLSPRTLAFMRRNHLEGEIASMGPSSFAEMPMHGTGFGLGGAVVLEPARAGVPGSVGDFGWGGMASTYFWTDPVEELCCVFFTQLIPSSSYPNRAELKALVHAALVD